MTVEIERTLQNLTPNTRYVVRVRAYNKLGIQSDWSEALDFRTGDDGSIPATPTGYYTTPGLQAIVVTWNRNTEVDFNHYELYASVTSGFTPDSTNIVYNARATSYSHPTESGQHWFFRLRAVDVAGNASPFTAEFSDLPNYITNNDIVAGTIRAQIIETSTLEADLILAGSIKTAASGARMELDSAGFRGYALDGFTVNINYKTSDGSLAIKGNITSGSIITGSTIIGTNISGSTITAGNPSAGHIVLDSFGLRGYAPDGVTTVLDYDAALGSLVISGAIDSSSTISGTINIGPNKFVVPAGGTIFCYANVVFGLNYSGGVYFSDSFGNADSNWGMQANSFGSTVRNLLMYYPDASNIRQVGFWDSRNSRFVLHADTFGNLISDSNNIIKHTRNLATGVAQDFAQQGLRLSNTVSGPVGISFDAQGDSVAAILNLDSPASGVELRARDSTDSSFIPFRASAFNVSSSSDTKRNIRSLGTNMGAKIDNLRVVRFNRPSVSQCSLCNGTGMTTVEVDNLPIGSPCPRGVQDTRSQAVKMTEDSDFFGIVAEETGPIIPEITTWEMDNGKVKAAGIDLNGLTAILLKEVQLLRKRIKQLEG